MLELGRRQGFLPCFAELPGIGVLGEDAQTLALLRVLQGFDELLEVALVFVRLLEVKIRKD